MYLVRHVETRENIGQRRVRGNLDTPPDPRGIQQVRALGEKFRGLPIAIVFTSPLARALSVAQAIQASTGAQLVPLPGLKSWDRGIYTGQLESEAKPYMDWFFEHADTKIPDGESYGDAYNRWTQILQRILALSKRANQDFAIITHAHFLNATPSILTGGEEPIAIDSAPSPGSVVQLTSTAKGWKAQIPKFTEKEVSSEKPPDFVGIENQSRFAPLGATGGQTGVSGGGTVPRGFGGASQYPETR